MAKNVGPCVRGLEGDRLVWCCHMSCRGCSDSASVDCVASCENALSLLKYCAAWKLRTREDRTYFEFDD